jgi:hypothetical protein
MCSLKPYGIGRKAICGRSDCIPCRDGESVPPSICAGPAPSRCLFCRGTASNQGFLIGFARQLKMASDGSKPLQTRRVVGLTSKNLAATDVQADTAPGDGAVPGQHCDGLCLGFCSGNRCAGDLICCHDVSGMLLRALDSSVLPVLTITTFKRLSSGKNVLGYMLHECIANPDACAQVFSVV